jgi:hypothetical protein
MPDSKPSYKLFKDTPCIPRLTMSEGCLYRCSFCTIPRKVKALPVDEIYAQVASFEPLQFQLVYLDDKTFGQADTWQLLKPIYNRIKAYNPNFKGFIVQTTAHEVNKSAELWVKEYHVKYIEVGLETMDAATLANWHKPHAPKHLIKAGNTIYDLQQARHYVKLIPNVIFGIAGDSRGAHNYDATLATLQTWKHVGIISHINPFILCQYHNSKGNVAEHTDNTDTDENTFEKSWLTLAEQQQASRALDKFLISLS